MITPKDYDDRIIAGGLKHQIDTYYDPVDSIDKTRINIVMKAIDPKSNERILDVGCGVGTFAFHCAKLGARTFGVDYSPESIKVANELSAKFKVSQNATFVVGDATALPYENEYFDKIVAADFVEHVTLSEKEMLVKEMYRVLKPKGFVVVFTPNRKREEIGAFYWKIRNILFRDKIPATELHFGLTYRGEFEEMCKKYNFKLELRYEDVTRPYLAKIPILRKALALNLLWVMKKA